MKKQKAVKHPAGVTQEFVDSLNSMQTDELKQTVVRLQVQNQENEEFKESKTYVEAKAEFDYAKERFDLVAAPVREVTISLKNRTKLAIDRLKEKGLV